MLGGKALELLTPATGIRADQSRCVHRRFSRASCRLCAQACPSGAMAVEKGARIDPALCTACRRCEAVCPTGALQGDERDLSSLASSLAQFPEPVLGCRIPGVQAHVHTECLGFLQMEGLLALALFFPEGLTLNLTLCRGCRNEGIVQGLEAALAEMRTLPGDLGGGRLRLARSGEDLRYREIDLSRREFFTFLRRRSADAVTLAATRLQQAPPPDASSKALPAQRRLFLRALSLVPTQVRQEVEGRVFPNLQFGSACTGCTGCAGICPTGAITTAEADPPRPVYLRHLCTGCGLCAEFCRKGGILFT